MQPKLEKILGKYGKRQGNPRILGKEMKKTQEIQKTQKYHKIGKRWQRNREFFFNRGKKLVKC